MRKYIIVALVLCVLGVGVSLLLIPTEDEVVELQKRDVAQIDSGNVDLQAEYNQGRRSFPIVNGLVEEKIAAGDRPGAIKILEEHVAASPNDVNARKALAEQYQLAGEMQKYNAQLEQIAEAEPTEQNLKILSDIYNAEKNYEKQAATLKRLITITNSSNPDYFVDLATIQALLNDNEGQLVTIEALRAQHPTYISYPMTRIYVDAVSRQKRLDDALATAETWMRNNAADASGLADLMNILHYTGGSAQHALKLVEARMNLLQSSPELVLAFVNANIANNQRDVAYNTLRQIDDAGTLHPSLYGTYLNLTISRNELDTTNRIIASLDPTVFSEQEAMNLIELARTSTPNDTFLALVERFNTIEATQNKPVLAAIVATSLGTADEDQAIEAALQTELNDIQRLRLGQACARTKNEMCFTAIAQQFPSLASMTPQQIAEISELHIQAGRSADLVDNMNELYAANPQSYVRHQQLRLAASAGRSDIVNQWLAADAANTSDENTREYFYIASNNNHSDITSSIANHLFQKNPSPENRDVLITALIKANKKTEALPHLREKANADPSQDALYLSTLSELAKTSKSAKKELTDYAARALRDNKGDSRQQINYAYILINNGKRSAVIPIAKQKSKTEGGEWRKMYAQLTRSTGGKAAAPRKPSIKQQIAKANNPKTTQADRKQIAFDLLERGQRNEAAKIFQSLAYNKGPESQEVKDLLYVWKGDISGNRLNWVIAQARNASPAERDGWSKLVHGTGNKSHVLRYTAQTPGALYYQPIRQQFFRLLAEQGNGSNFTVRMRDWMRQTTDIAALHDYARTALDFNHKPLAKETYERIVSIAPQNKQAMRQLGTLKFTTGQFTASEKFLTRAVSLPAEGNSLQDIQSDSQARFFRAELLKRNGNLSEARREYTRVIDLEQQAAALAGGLSSDGKTRLFSALFHVGRHQEAMRGFNSMLEANPSDRSTLADYLSVLIEYDYIDQAMAISNKYDPKGRRVDRLSSLHNTMPEWLANSDWAREHEAQGYEIRFVPTSNVRYRTVPEQNARYYRRTEREVGVSKEVAQARQQELRLQLLYARIEQESGQDERARKRLAQLSKYYPNEPQLMAYQANVERTNGNPIGALRILEQARALAPENEDFGVLEREIRRTQNTNFARADHEHRSFGKQNEHITTLSGATRVTDRAEIGFTAQNNAMRTKNFRNAETGLIDDYDTTRQNGELYAAYYFEDGARLKGSFFANNDTPGVGISGAFNNDFGRTELIAEYHRPYTDFVEAVFEHTVRDRLGARHSVALTPSLSFGAEAFINRYNTHLAKDVTKSGLVRANLVYALRHQQPYLGVGYGFDGEYLFGKQKFRLDRFNNAYKLLPLVSREVHALTGILQHDLTETTHLSLFGGWTIDRLGEQGPVIEGRLTQDLTDSLEAGIRARYGRQTNDSDNNATHLGGHVQYKF